METIKFNFAKNFTAKVSISDLEKLGWNFEYDDTAEAMNMSLEEAEKYVKEKYDVQITVDEKGNTFERFEADGTMCENRETGDDKQTIEDLKNLHAEEKLYDEENY